MILSNHFFDLLDCLAGQFFGNSPASCSGEKFGINISSNAKEYFSIAIIPEELSNNLDVLGVLFDDSAYIPSRNGFTFAIYIDLSKYSENSKNVQDTLFSIILAHEICHFAFYYELFLMLGDNTGIVAHSNFTHSISGTFMGAVIQEQDKTSQTLFDGHNIADLVRNLKEFPKSHFSKGHETKIDYKRFLDGFLKHFNISII
jgi:hypothetical protein